jgi:hypothetical protein
MGTEAQIKDAIAAGFYVMDGLRYDGAVVGDSFISGIKDFIDKVGLFKGDRAARAIAGMTANVRANYAAAVDSDTTWLDPLLSEYMSVLEYPIQSRTLNMQSLYLDYALNGKRVKSRGFTYDSVHAVGSPVGDGTIYRNNTDAHGFKIENCYAQTITMECVKDQNNGGIKFKESFRFRAQGANIDNIIVNGSNDDAVFPGLSSDDSSSYFQNCSFSSMNGTGTTKFDNWTITSGSHALFTQDTADYFQVTPGDPVAACLDIADNGIIQQAFSLRNTQFPNGAPMLVRVPWKRNGANAGAEVWVRFGEQVAKVTLGGAESGWQTSLYIELSDRAWYRNYAKNGGVLAVEIHGLSAGSIKIDNIIVAPKVKFAGLWFAPCAGQTPFKVGDRYYVTDTCPDTSIIQRQIVLATEMYLPHDSNSSAITWPDPVAHT